MCGVYARAGQFEIVALLIVVNSPLLSIVKREKTYLSLGIRWLVRRRLIVLFLPLKGNARLQDHPIMCPYRRVNEQQGTNHSSLVS